MPNKISRFWYELKRRKVIHVVVVYASASFVIIELVNNIYQTLKLPEWTPALTLILLVIGFPLAIIFSWIYEKSSNGFVRTDSIDEISRDKETDSSSVDSNIPDNSIIVLPFENISSDPDQEYFSDGLTEEIITDLSFIDDLLVISRSSAMTFKGNRKPIKEITNEVGVRYALEGSVRKAGDNIRIVAQLIDGTNDSHIWAEKYSGTLEDIFDIQEKVSRSIAGVMKIKLSSREKAKIDQRPIDNAFAYDCLKRAYPEISSMSKERIDYGLNLLQKGFEVTGENAVIYAGMANAYMQYVNNGYETEKNIAKTEEFLEKALSLDPELPEALFALGGIILFKEQNIKHTLDLWKRAHLSSPEDPEIMIYLALVYAIIGQNEAAYKLVEKISIIDPINPMCDAVNGWVNFFSGRYEKAIDPLFAAYNLTPDSVMHQFFKALILLYNDRADEAYHFINETVDESINNVWTRLTVLMKYAIKKDKEKVASLMKPDVVAQIQSDLQNSFHTATFYALLDEKEEALKWLEIAVDGGFINYPLLNEQDVLLEIIRKEEGFISLMKRVKKEWENNQI
jgi:TolB-like protein